MSKITQAEHARWHARDQMAERIAANYPFSAFRVWMILDELSEAEAHQVCALACRLQSRALCINPCRPGLAAFMPH